MIEIVSTLPLNTVQDLGREGRRHIGVSTSGAMDAPALVLGNLIVGNAAEAAGIEVQTFPFEMRFIADARFAVTGADCAATLDGAPLLSCWNLRAQAGQTLRMRYPSQGARAYVAVAGGIDVPEVLGSRSTDLRSGFGGFEGRQLARGDRLPIGVAPARCLPEGFGVVPHARALRFGAEQGASIASTASPESVGEVIYCRALRAGEYDRFPAAMQRSLWTQAWQVTHQSNRAGYRLAGAPLRPFAHIEMRSYGVVPGLIQVPPGGQPIVQLSDANTAGGYPKIAAVIEADLWRLGQARPGSRIRFVDVDYAEAQQARKTLDTFLAKTEAAIAALQQRAVG